MSFSGFQYTVVSGTEAGTAAITESPGVVRNIFIGQNKEGTVTFYDNSGGTSTATQVIVVNNNAGSIPTAFPVNAQFKNGITVAKGGTTDMLVMWE